MIFIIIYLLKCFPPTVALCLNNVEETLLVLIDSLLILHNFAFCTFQLIEFGKHKYLIKEVVNSGIEITLISNLYGK